MNYEIIYIQKLSQSQKTLIIKIKMMLKLCYLIVNKLISQYYNNRIIKTKIALR